MKAVMKYFTRKIVIQIGDDFISFCLGKRNNDLEQVLERFSFHDIEGYQFQFPTYRFTSLILNLKSGKKKEFSFLRQQTEDTEVSNDFLIESIQKSFRQYNTLKDKGETIKLKPSFYASKNGFYTIIFLVLFLLIPITIIIGQHKSLPITLIFTSLIIVHLILRRIADLKLYNKQKDF